MADQRPGDKTFGGSVPNQGATGIFGFVEDGDEAAGPPATPLPPAPTPQVVTPLAPDVASTSPEVAGFTQVWRALSSEPAARPSASLEFNPSDSTDAVPLKPVTPSPSPGGFTEIFGSFEDSGKMAKPAATPPPASEGITKAFAAPTSDSGSLTATLPVFSSSSSSGRHPIVETPVVSSAPVPPPVAEKPAAVGEFTRIFQALDSKPPDAPVFSSPIAPPAVSAPAAISTPTGGADSGGFTQLLRAFETSKSPVTSSAPEVIVSPPVMAPQATVSPVAPPPQSTGSFTQLFQALGPAPGGTPAPTSSQTGHGFTESFSALGTDASRIGSQADSFPPIAPSPASSPVYQVPDMGTRTSIPRHPDPVFAPPSPTAPSPVSCSLEDALRALNGASNSNGQSVGQSFSAAPRNEPEYPPQVWRESAPPAQSTPQNQYTYPEPGSAGAPRQQSAPGGVTSIINASQLREIERMARQGGTAAPPVGPAPTASAAAPALGSMPPLQYPSTPAYPPMSNYPPTTNPAQGGSWPIPSNPMQISAPQLPHMSPPSIPAPATPQAGGAAKAWLPILLIVIIVLLVGILLAVLLIKK